MTADLVLVRHARVDDRYRGVCYGRSDVLLGSQGREDSIRLAETIARWPIRHLIASGAARTTWLAEQIASRVDVAVETEPALLERDFGAWELQTWDDIYAQTGDAMHGLIHQPATYCPPGGETTIELRDRVVAWYHRRPLGGLVVAVTHGGPIAALRGTLRGKEPVDWVDLIPPTGTWVALTGGVE